MPPLATEVNVENTTTQVQTDTVPRANKYRKLFKKIWIHASRNVLISTDSERETGESRMVFKWSLGH